MNGEKVTLGLSSSSRDGKYVPAYLSFRPQPLQEQWGRVLPPQFSLSRLQGNFQRLIIPPFRPVVL